MNNGIAAISSAAIIIGILFGAWCTIYDGLEAGVWKNFSIGFVIGVSVTLAVIAFVMACVLAALGITQVVT